MKWSFIVVGYLSLFTLGLADNVRGPLFPDMISSLHLSDTEAGWFFATSSLASLMGSLLTQKFLPRWGSFSLLQFFFGLLFLGYLGIGLASHYSIILFCSSLAGIGFGGVGVIQNILVQRGAHPNKLRQFMSGLHAMYGLSSLLAPLLIAVFFKWSISWNTSFILVSLFPLLLSLGLLKTKEEKNEFKSPSDLTLSLKDHFSHFLFGLIVTFYVMSELILSTRLSLFLQRVHFMSRETASYYLSFFFVFLLLGRLLFALKSFSFSHRSILYGSSLFSIFFFILGIQIHPFFLTVVAFFMGPFFPALMSLASEFFKEKFSSSVTYMLTMMGVGIVAMNWSMGFVSDHFGILNAMWMLPVFLFIVMALTLFSRKLQG